MKNYFFTIAIFFLACSAEEPPEFSITGKWKAINWYCTHQDNCSREQDPQAYLTFSVKGFYPDGSLEIESLAYFSPVCDADPMCYSGSIWQVDSASFTKDDLYLHLMTSGPFHYFFKGTLEKDIFAGTVESFNYGMGHFLFNDHVEIIWQGQYGVC